MTTQIVKLKNKVQKDVDTLTELFGYHTNKVQRSSCYGDWKGTWDYSIVFDDKVEYFIANGLKYFEEAVAEKVKEVQSFLANKNTIIEKFKNLEAQDTKRLAESKKQVVPYELLDIDIKTSGRHIGWYFLKLKIHDNEVVSHIEAHLHYEIKELALNPSKEISLNTMYKVAGSVSSKSVDYIINNVGFDSKSPFYKIRDDESAVV